MNRFAAFFCAMVMVLSSGNLLAQGRGRHGGAPGGAAPGTSNDTSIIDFKIALAIQASPDQMAEFQSLRQTTEEAQKQSLNLQQVAGTSSNSIELVRQGALLKGALEDAANDTQTFLQSFSKIQKDQLKDPSKKLEKGRSDLVKEGKTLDVLLKSPKADIAGLTAVAERTQNVLTELRATQLSLADKMGTQSASK